MKQPKIVRKLTTLCNGWIIGSAAIESNEDPRDYDVFIPIEYWQQASSYITDDAKINTFGGFKVISDGKEVDIWTGKMEEILASNYFKAAYHQKTGVRIVRV